MVRHHNKSLNVVIDFSVISVSIFPLHYQKYEFRIPDDVILYQIFSIRSKSRNMILSTSSTEQIRARFSTSVFHPAGMEIFICTLSLLVRAVTYFHNLNDMLNYQDCTVLHGYYCSLYVQHYQNFSDYSDGCFVVCVFISQLLLLMICLLSIL